MRALTSGLALLLAGLTLAQPFGRFGYSALPTVPGFRLGTEGFRSSSIGADTLRFVRPLEGFRATQVSDKAASYEGPEIEGMPSKIRVNLRAPGFEMYFPKGVRLGCSALQNPFLSWSDGSAGPDVPAPRSPWLLLSFQNIQPPLLLAFPNTQTELVTQGKAGEWWIASKGAFSGWVRFCLPFGHYGRAGTSVSSLGGMVQELKASIGAWTAPAPVLVGFEVRADEASVTAVWTFDRPGAMVPPAALMARTGGYPIEILSGVKATGADLWDGPVAFTTELKLAIKFPVVTVPVGRSLALGTAPMDMIATASPFDVPSLCDLALASLLCGRDHLVVGAADTVTTEFLSQTAQSVEVHTQRRVPFLPDGSGVDLAAAHALVEQCRSLARGSAMAESPLFAQVSWRRDWITWLVWAEDRQTSRRASALLALAGALGTSPERRLDAGMYQAGLAADRALGVYRSRRGFAWSGGDLLEPLYNLRGGLFMTSPDRFVASLKSEVRIVTDQSVTVDQTQAGVVVRFQAEDTRPGTLVFEIGRPVTAVAVSNLKSLVGRQALGRLTIEYVPAAVGECRLLLKSPGWTNPLPSLVRPPRYVEG